MTNKRKAKEFNRLIRLFRRWRLKENTDNAARQCAAQTNAGHAYLRAIHLLPEDCGIRWPAEKKAWSQLASRRWPPKKGKLWYWHEWQLQPILERKGELWFWGATGDLWD